MSTLRNKDTGEPGNGGQFTTTPGEPPEVTLPPASLAERLHGRHQVIRDESDPDDVEGNGSWPPPPDIRVTRVTGNLAERVRRRVGASKRAEVLLREETWYGGYSEWTQENETTFEVSCGGRTVTFYPDRDGTYWDPTEFDSVYARFDAWLAVAERPEELFAEWFEGTPEVCNWWVAWTARKDTTLWSCAKRSAHHRLGAVQLYLHPVGGYQNRHLTLAEDVPTEWILRFIEPPTETGFRAVSTQTRLPGLPADASPQVLLEAVTDRLLPTRS